MKSDEELKVASEWNFGEATFSVVDWINANVSDDPSSRAGQKAKDVRGLFVAVCSARPHTHTHAHTAGRALYLAPEAAAHVPEHF